MSLSGLLVFASAYFAALILPGPGVTALLARAGTRAKGSTDLYCRLRLWCPDLVYDRSNRSGICRLCLRHFLSGDPLAGGRVQDTADGACCCRGSE
jgi:hypothetical protein